MSIHEKLGAQFAQMTEADFEASAGSGRRWVYHASDYPGVFDKGVRMENVPRNLARVRYEAGEYAEYQPGAGLGKGTYVGSSPGAVGGFGHHMFAISVPHEHLELPPEAGHTAEEYPNFDVDYYMKNATGALLTHDVGVQHIVRMGQIKTSNLTGHEAFQLQAMRRGEHVPEELQSESLKERRAYAKERGWEL